MGVQSLLEEIEPTERVVTTTQLEDGQMMLITERRPSGPKNRETR